jgi:very-short-patch-repair endonuclease
MRRAPTPAEWAMWQALKRRRLLGLRFRRQHPIAGFIVDFYCPELRLAVEVDGSVHAERVLEDASRDTALANLGVMVIRIRNEDAMADIEGAVSRLEDVVTRRAAESSGTPAVAANDEVRR